MNMFGDKRRQGKRMEEKKGYGMKLEEKRRQGKRLEEEKICYGSRLEEKRTELFIVVCEIHKLNSRQ